VPADNAQIQKAIAKLHEQQNGDGGFPYVSPSPWGTDSDANSTAVVIWALLAVGEDPGGVDWKVQGQDGLSAMDKLRAFQNDSGAFRWQDAMPDDNFLATIQAAVAIEWKTLPFARMDVGADTEVGAAAAETTPEAEPEALPETGGNLWTPVFALLGSGATLTGIGLALRRRR
jgi:LPXTG-motif cell wall-anchored protein